MLSTWKPTLLKKDRKKAPYNDSMHLSWYGLHKFVQNLMTHVTPAWFDYVTKSFLWCHIMIGFLRLQVPHKSCSMGLRSGDCSGNVVNDSQDSQVFFSLQVVLAKVCLWSPPVAVWILQTRGHSMSLKSGVVPLLVQDVVNLEQVSISRVRKRPQYLNNPTTFHCGFNTLLYRPLSCSSPYIHPSVTAINLRLGFISK